MYRNYKIVVNTAAGRRRYMQYLVPFIVSSGIVDRYDIWINTHNGADIEFFKRLAEKYPVINLVWQPDGVVCGNQTINAFYRQCVEDNTIYFKMDDDIVWMEPDAIKEMVDFRIDNPQYFLVSPLVINNSLSTYLLQVCGKIKLSQYCKSSSSHEILWRSGDFAYQLHHWFIERHLRLDKVSELHLGKHEMGMTRFSINAVLWFGDEMKKLDGNVPGDDEEFLSCIYPTTKGMSNCWNGDVIFSHFAFFTQREELDKKSILEQYGKYLHEFWTNNEHISQIDGFVQSVISDIKDREAELMAKPSPYKNIYVSKDTHPVKAFIKGKLPVWVYRAYLSLKPKHNKTVKILN